MLPNSLSSKSQQSVFKARRPVAAALALVLLSASCLFAGLGALRAVPENPSKTEAPEGSLALEAQLRAKLEEVRGALARFQAGDACATNLPPGAKEAEAIEFRSLLQLIAKTYQTHLDQLAAIDDIRQRRQEFERTTQAWTTFDEPPPYSVLFVDGLRDEVRSLQEKIDLAHSALSFADELTAHFESSLKSCDSDLRRIGEQLESEQDGTLVIRLNWQRQLAQMRGQLAAATLASFETVRRKNRDELAEYRLRLAFAQMQLTQATRQTRFTRSDLEKALASLESDQRHFEADLQSADADLEKSKTALAEAREALGRALHPPTGLAPDPAAVHRLQDVVETREAQEQTDAETVSGVRQLLDGVSLDRQLWQARFAVFSTRDVAELRDAFLRLEKLSALASSSRQYYTQKAEVTARQAVELSNEISNASDPQLDMALAQERRDALQKRVLIYRRILESVAKRERLVACWKESLELNRKNLPFFSRVRDLFTETTGFAAKLWNFELFVAEDTITVDGQTIKGRRGVTVGKILRVVLFLIVGYCLSSLAARGMQRLAVRRLGIDRNQANLIRRWICIALMTAVVVFSLILVKIPLTVFTFAGGALAIGLGFGTQNLIKNFISGIIILFERPFRVGDVLDIDGRRGTVTGIGIRSSVVLFWDGTETLIPNSSLLENNLTNWTFSSRSVRFTVSVGVAYGTDTALVTRLLAEIAQRHGLVQKEPPPQVLFTDFGDSNLCFELRFWIDVAKHNAAQVSSDLRHMVAKAFAEHGVSMAFPQRDLHWDRAPLQVRITRDEAAGSDAKA